MKKKLRELLPHDYFFHEVQAEGHFQRVWSWEQIWKASRMNERININRETGTFLGRAEGPVRGEQEFPSALFQDCFQQWRQKLGGWVHPGWEDFSSIAGFGMGSTGEPHRSTGRREGGPWVREDTLVGITQSWVWHSSQKAEEYVTKHLKQFKRGEGLFWLVMSQVSVHTCLALLPLGHR